MMIYLSGTHGAGKTTLIRNLAKVYGISGDEDFNYSECKSLGLIGPYLAGRKAGGLEALLGRYNAERIYEIIEEAWGTDVKVLMAEGKPFNFNKLLNFFLEMNEKHKERELVVLTLRIGNETSVERRLERTGKTELTEKQYKYTEKTVREIYGWVERGKVKYPTIKWLDVSTEDDGVSPEDLVKYVLLKIFPESALDSIIEKAKEDVKIGIREGSGGNEGR